MNKTIFWISVVLIVGLILTHFFSGPREDEKKESLPEYLTNSDLFQRVLGWQTSRHEDEMRVTFSEKDSLIHIDHFGEYENTSFPLNLDGILVAFYSVPAYSNVDRRKVHTTITFGDSYIPFVEKVDTERSSTDFKVIN